MGGDVANAPRIKRVRVRLGSECILGTLDVARSARNTNMIAALVSIVNRVTTQTDRYSTSKFELTEHSNTRRFERGPSKSHPLRVPREWGSGRIVVRSGAVVARSFRKARPPAADRNGSFVWLRTAFEGRARDSNGRVGFELSFTAKSRTPPLHKAQGWGTLDGVRRREDNKSNIGSPPHADGSRKKQGRATRPMRPSTIHWKWAPHRLIA